MKKSLIFDLDSETCHYLPKFELFLSVGNHKPNIKPKFSIQLGPRAAASFLTRAVTWVDYGLQAATGKAPFAAGV